MLCGRGSHAFSYIVSLPVSENVSGVAILAAFGEKVMTEINTRTNLGVVPVTIAIRTSYRRMKTGSDAFE